MKRDSFFRTTLAAFAGGMWLTLVSMRQTWIIPRCLTNPELCSPDALGWTIDRLGYGYINAYSRADELSYWSQNFSGAFVLGVIWLTTKVESGRRKFWLYAAFLATLVNGTLTEAIRLFAQRPRPFVLASPLTEGGAYAHYTSFISGHTSFSAMACTLAVVVAWRERRGLRAVVPLAIALPVITAVCRVLAGRHYVTDTIGGALAGAFVALLIAAWWGPQSRIRSPQSNTNAKKLPSHHLPDRIH